MAAPLKLGFFVPVLQLNRGHFSPWEVDGTLDDVRRIAVAAEQLGYDYLACPEHVAIPGARLHDVNTRWWDPLATYSYLSAFTSRIRFATLVLVLPIYHPLEIVKRYGTLDRISGGRLVLGVGVGSLPAELELLSVPVEGRNERADDALRALKASFGRPEPVYEGSHYQFRDVVVDPCGLQTNLPLWIGGQTRRSLRRAVELGSGWSPFSLSPETVSAWLNEARASDAWEVRDKPLDVLLSTLLDPLGDPEGAAYVAGELHDAGATGLSLRFRHDSPEHCIEQLEAMVEVVAKL